MRGLEDLPVTMMKKEAAPLAAQLSRLPAGTSVTVTPNGALERNS